MAKKNEEQPILTRLCDTELILSDPTQDVIGYKVLDQDGDEIGHVQDLMIDEEKRKVRFLEVVSGGFLGIGEHIIMIPVDAITEIKDGVITISHSKETILKAPKYDPELSDNDFWEGLYGYYGYWPYWAPGYMYPGYPFIR